MKASKQLCICRYWIIARGDQFCGWCGRRFSGLECHLSDPAIYLGKELGSKQVQLRVRNTGLNAIKVLDLASDSPLAVFTDHPSPQAPITIPAQGTHGFTLTIDLVHARDEFRAINLTVLTDLAGIDQATSAVLRLMPKPLFNLRQEKELVIVLDGENAEENLVTLELLKGRAKIIALEAEVPWAKVRPLETDLPVEMTEERPKLRLKLEINEIALLEAMRVDKARRETVKFQVAVKSEGMVEKPSTFPLEMRTHRPAALSVTLQGENKTTRTPRQPGRIECEVFKGARRRYFNFTLTLENKGDVDLLIQKVAIADAPEGIELPVTSGLGDPISKDGGFDLTLRIDAEAVPVGDKRCDVLIYCNDPDAKNGVANFPLVIRATELKPYPGIVAMDFGTTNTCVAVYNRRTMGPPKVIKFSLTGRTSGGKSVPSVIHYRNKMPDNKREYEVGEIARRQIASHGTEESIITSVKRKLGQDKPVSFRYSKQPETLDALRPDEIAGDIIGAILEELETHAEIRAQILECVISHPVHYLSRRLEAIEHAFRAANVKISTRISEPLAAAIDFILQYTEANKSYTLMVWDMGGGTTDVAYLRVRIELDADERRRIFPELLGADGDRWFGGDNITDLILRHFAEICQISAIKALNDSDISIQVDLKDINLISDERMRRATLSNYVALLQRAEEAKIEVSTSGKEWRYRQELKFWRDGEIKTTVSLNLDLETLNKLAGPSVEEAMIYMMELIARNGNQPPDKILLAGSSSRLPIVSHRMQAVFGNTDCEIINASSKDGNNIGHFKESVAIGLCKYRMQATALAAERFADLLTMPVATSNIGVRISRGGVEIFEPIIKKGDSLNEWYQIKGAYVSPDTIPEILSCSGRSTELKGNPYLDRIGEFPLEELAGKFSGDDFDKAQLFLKVTTEERVIFKIEINGHSHEFNAVLPPEFG